MNLGDAAVLSLIGIAIVFSVLVVLMVIIVVMGKISAKSADVISKMHKNEESGEGAAEMSSDEPVAAGTCGELVLIKTEERDAAMIMAIVADATETPLNELRFKSIKRIDEEN